MAIQGKRFKGAASISTLQPELVLIVGRVAIGASGAVAQQSGKGFTVTRNGTGLYTVQITSQGGVPAVLFAQAAIVNNSATVAFEAYARVLPTTGAITIVTTAAGAAVAAADPPQGSYLELLVIVQNAQITG